MLKKAGVSVNDQEVPILEDLEIPDGIRSAENQRPVSPNYDLIEPSLSEDIMNIVNQQKSSRKRLSEAFDVSQRLPKVPRLENHESLPLNISLPAFDENANVVEEVGEEVPDIPDVPPIFPERKLVKARQKKRKLVLDKTMKISDDEILENVRDYKEKMTEISPMADFAKKFAHSKFSVEKLFTAPGTRLKFCAGKELLPLYLRNLKVHKRMVSVDEDGEGPPAKKRKLGAKTSKVDEIVIPVVEDIQIPADIQILKDIQMPEDIQIPLPDLKPIKQLQKIKTPKKKAEIESQTIRER